MATRAFATRSAMLDDGARMLHLPALDQVRQALTQEARVSLTRPSSSVATDPRCQAHMATTNVIPGVHVSVLPKL